jgi:two-component system LytT family response regulator
MKHKYVIVEDEKAALNNLKTALKSKSSYVYKGHAATTDNAIELIYNEKPDLVFLDVELGNENGFKVIQELKTAFYDLPAIIMTTGHDHYAKDAVNNQVTYFLSKPINPIELSKALHIFEKKHATQKSKLYVRKGNVLEVVDFDDILFLQADGNYTYINYTNGKKGHIPKTLKYFETQLNTNFMRVHKSYIANVKHLREIKLSEKELILQGKEELFSIYIGKDYVSKMRNQLKI